MIRIDVFIKYLKQTFNTIITPTLTPIQKIIKIIIILHYQNNAANLQHVYTKAQSLFNFLLKC